MNHRPSVVLAVACLVVCFAAAANASPYLHGGQAPPSSMPEPELEALPPMSVPQSVQPLPPPARSLPSLASNLPPSALSVSYYDNTEYEVSPLRMPLELPHPPPPPSFDSAEATKQANAFLETGARFGAQQQQQQMMPQQQMMMQQQQQQQQRYAMQPMLFQQQQRVMGPMPPQGNAPFLPNPPAAPTIASFFQQPQQQQMMMPPQQQMYAPQPMLMQQQQRMYMAPPPSRRHLKLKHRLQRRGGHRAHMVKGGTMTPRTVRRARVHQQFQQQQPAVHYGAPGPVTVSLLQTQSQLHTTTRNLAQAGTPTFYRNGQTVPWITNTPASVTTRGAVPHFQATIRSLPGQSPYATNNNDIGLQPSFIEQQASTYATRDAFGRPVEPVLPRLPGPPVADVIVQ